MADELNDAPKGAFSTVHQKADGLFVAVLMEPTPEGFHQVSEKGDEHEDYVDAKREAVRIAQRAGIEFRSPYG